MIPMEVALCAGNATVPWKLMPVRVTAWVVPASPVVGLIEVRPIGGTVTVKVTALLVPPAPVTVTFPAPAVAPAAMLRVAVIVVALVTVKPVTMTPVFRKVNRRGSGQARAGQRYRQAGGTAVARGRADGGKRRAGNRERKRIRLRRRPWLPQR